MIPLTEITYKIYFSKKLKNMIVFVYYYVHSWLESKLWDFIS